MSERQREPRQSLERAALDVALDDRRTHLRMKWVEVAAAADISTATLHRVRTSDAVLTRDTKAGLEDALRLERGSIDRKLAGGEFIPLPEEVAERERSTAVPHEFSTEARSRILEMTLNEILNFCGDMAARSSPRAAEDWLRAALQLRIEVLALTSHA